MRYKHEIPEMVRRARRGEVCEAVLVVYVEELAETCLKAMEDRDMFKREVERLTREAIGHSGRF